MDKKNINDSATYSEMVENGKLLAEDVASGKVVMEDGWSYIGCGWWSYFSPKIHVTKSLFPKE